MTLLILYVALALGVSFLCSVAEAVLLSVTPTYVELLRKQGRPAGELLHRMKQDINAPLAAILTLNTIAHTIGAAGAGAQAAAVFGSQWLGLASAVLTLLILVFSEIIPKTLGAVYWRALAPATAHALRVLVVLLYPFVRLSSALTAGIGAHPTLRGFSRHEFQVMAELGEREGTLHPRERQILRNLLRLRELRPEHAMTPRTVIFSLPEDMTVGDWFAAHADTPFSRIPVWSGSRDRTTGFVLRADLLLAMARDQHTRPLSEFRRELLTLPDSVSLLHALDLLTGRRAHISLVVDEYGGIRGLLTLEDVLETLLGLEILDEADQVRDMQRHARRLWNARARAMGLDVEQAGAEDGDDPAR